MVTLGEAMLLIELSKISFMNRDYNLAEKVEECLGISNEIGDRLHQAISLQGLAEIEERKSNTTYKIFSNGCRNL